VYPNKNYNKPAKQTLAKSLFVVALCCAGSTAQAASVGVRASTLGLGVELTQSLYPTVKTRFGVNRYSIESDVTQDGINYTQSLNLSSVAALIDWHPFAGGFRVSGGLLINNNAVELQSGSQASYNVGGETYTTTDLSIKGKVSFQPVTPYLGLGWASTPKSRGLSLSAEVGVVYMGEADVKLSATGSVTDSNGTSFDVANDAVFHENLVLEEKTLENDIDEFVFYPVISLGVSFAF